MADWVINGLVSIHRVMQEAGAEAIRLIDSGPVEVIVQKFDERDTDRRRTTAQNRLIYKIYQRIGKTLYGGDESHARNECKLRIGCRILYRDSKDFAETFDRVIRPLSHETRMQAMNLISVSSIMTINQSTEYIKTIMTEYGQRQVYFLDLDGADEYLKYPESKK